MSRFAFLFVIISFNEVSLSSYPEALCSHFIPVILILSGSVLLILAVIGTYFNNRRDGKNGYIDHSKALWLKSLFCLPSYACYVWASCYTGKWIWCLLFSFFLVCSWFYLLFEGLWGWQISNDFWYRGEATGKNQANSDKLVKPLRQWVYIAIKLALILSSTFLYSKLFN